MKKYAMSSLLVLSSIFTVVGMGQANAVDYSSTQHIANTHSHEARKLDDQRRGFDIERGLMAQLNLSDTQKSQITAIKEAERAKHQNERESKKAEHEQHREQLQALTNSTTLNTTVLNTLADEHAKQAKQRFIDRVQTRHAIAQVLTPEQRTQFEQLREQRRERGRGFR